MELVKYKYAPCELEIEPAEKLRHRIARALAPSWFLMWLIIEDDIRWFEWQRYNNIRDRIEEDWMSGELGTNANPRLDWMFSNGHPCTDREKHE